MRLLELHLQAFGPFTDYRIALGDDQRRLVLVHGLNEAGKSSALRAITALRYGIPDRSPDNFLHEYSKLRIGAVLADADGRRHTLVRRKGRGSTLKAIDPAQDGAELPDAVSGVLLAQLTAGLRAADHDLLFGLDHARLREGGAALERGDGELGAALFEASAGTVDVKALLQKLHDQARQLFNPATQSRNDRFRQALADYRQQSEQQRGLSVRATRWEQLQRDWAEAEQALQRLTAERQALLTAQATVKELIAVVPTLGELARCQEGLARLSAVRLLDEDAASQRAAAQAGLADALAGAQAAGEAAQEAAARQDAVTPDAAVLGVENAIRGLCASARAIDDHLGQAAQAQADLDAARATRQQAARAIAPDLADEALAAWLPAPALRARLVENSAVLGRAEQALELHVAAGALDTPAAAPPRELPDGAAVAALRQAVEQCQRGAPSLDAAAALARALPQARRDAATALASLGLADEAAARAVVPLLGAAIDQAVQAFADSAGARRDHQRRLQALRDDLSAQQRLIADLTEHGAVPTMADVAAARQRRAADWARVRSRYIDSAAAPLSDGMDCVEPIPPPADAYEAAVARADALVDGIVGDHERASRLAAARRRVVELQAAIAVENDTAGVLDADAARHTRDWHATLVRAGLPPMAGAVVRDWQARLAECLAAWNAVAARTAEIADIARLQDALCALLHGALNRLALAGVGEPVDAGESLATLQAMAQDGLREVAEHTKARDLAAGQQQQREQQQQQRARRGADLSAALAAARAALDADAAAIRLQPGAGRAEHAARLAEFAELQQAGDAVAEATRRLDGARASLQLYTARAEAIAAALGEPAPPQLHLHAERWQHRLDQARAGQAARQAAMADLQTAQRQAADAQLRARRHQATLALLCEAAGVASAEALPEAEAEAQRKRLLRADGDKAQALLARASRRSVEELEALQAGRDSALLRDEELALENRLVDVEGRLAVARAGEEQARLALAAVDDSDAAAEAADAMERAAATMRNAWGLQMRLRLAHGLLAEAVSRFKQRTQAPMLRGASAYFSQMTGGVFSGIASDDSEVRPVIVGVRAGAGPVAVSAMSEGTRDQLYLALRLAALDLQRDLGVDLPLVLDDVLMTSDDGRAACVLRALASFARRGQVIVFTHHRHLVEVAVGALGEGEVAVVELDRGAGG